jgi:hypothetical protein
MKIDIKRKYRFDNLSFVPKNFEKKRILVDYA